MGPPPSPSPSGNETLTSYAFSLRPNPSLSGHRTHLRVSLNRVSLVKLGLKGGDLCSISAVPKITTNGTITAEELYQTESKVKVYPGIAWITSEAQVTAKVVQVSEQLKDLIGIGFQSKVAIGPYLGKRGLAKKVTLEEVGENGGKITDVGGNWHSEGQGWSAIIRNELFEGKYAFTGMVVGGIKYLGIKRHFKVKNLEVENESEGIYTEISESKEIISAYNVTKETIVTIEDPLSPGQLTPAISLPTSSASKAKSDAFSPSPPPKRGGPTFAQIAGVEPQLAEIKETIVEFLRHPRLYSSMDQTPFRGIILYGARGTGKSLIMKAIANSLPIKNISTFRIDQSIVGPYRGEPEAKIRETFRKAIEKQPSIVFLDDIDKIASKSNKDTQDMIASTLGTIMDELNEHEENIFIVAATNKLNEIDEGLRRPGRLDQEIEIPRPDMAARYRILSRLLEKFKKAWLTQEPGQVEEDTVLKGLAARMHGYVGADLANVVRRALGTAFRRLPPDFPFGGKESGENVARDYAGYGDYVVLKSADIEEAMKKIKPTIMKEIIFEIPNVKWSDIGGQGLVKDRLREAVEWPLKHPDLYKRFGTEPHKGILLYGPPGCSKTLTAKALAAESGLNFLPIKGSELLNMYVGETERAIREVFAKAKAASPSIIFFDEIDALGATRNGSKNVSGALNIITTLLNEIDGMDELKDVTILAATNRPELLDPALMRPGRLGAMLYVGPPDLAARKEIFKIKKQKMPFHPDIDIDELALLTDGFSGAEVVKICNEACHHAMRESFDIESVQRRHFDMSLAAAVKQITPEMRQFYEKWSIGGVDKL